MVEVFSQPMSPQIERERLGLSSLSVKESRCHRAFSERDDGFSKTFAIGQSVHDGWVFEPDIVVRWTHLQ